MADTGKIAKNLERFAQAVAAHDRENPTHTAHGIGLAHFDMERLGLDTTYWTDIDLHLHGQDLVKHGALMSLGHDEYWSREMRNNADSALSAARVMLKRIIRARR